MNKKGKYSSNIGISSLLVLLLVLGGLFLLSIPASANPDVLYVAPVASGSGDCSSWANACSLQTALAGASNGDEIWVKAGVHYPGSNRTYTFTLQSGVAIYGGFAGTENTRDQRDWTVNVTVLSGDIDQNDITEPNGVVIDTVNIQGENAYHVVTGSEVAETAILDGFFITAGQANGDYPNWDGGGMTNWNSNPILNNVTFTGNFSNSGGGMANWHSNPILNNVTFSGNMAVAGGGMYNYSSNPTLTDVTFSANIGGQGGGMANWQTSDPTLTHVTFSNNSAGAAGGMYNYQNSSPMLTHVTFSGNSADTIGGGMLNDWIDSNPTLTNVTFSGNTAEVRGGGIANFYQCNPTLTNVTFSGNSAGENGGGMYNYDNSNSTLTNVIFWGNSAPNDAGIYNLISTPQISYSDIQGCGGSSSWNSTCGTDGSGNIDTDPLFVDSANGNLHLQLTSPAIDTGNNAVLSPDILTDLGGNPRFVDIPTVPDTGSGAAPIVDMGAFEAQYVDVTLSKAVLPTTAAPGQAISFTLTLANTGSIPATGIEVTDTIPAWLKGVSFTSTLTVTDTGNIQPYVWLVQDLVPGQGGSITVNGMLAVPLAAGTYTNTALISATDDLLAENNTAVITFTVTNIAPVFTSTPLIVAAENEPYTYTATILDDNGDTMTITATTIPSWLTIEDHNNGTATLSGTPTTADMDEHTVVLRVADNGELFNTQTFTITVYTRIYLPLVLRNTS